MHDIHSFDNAHNISYCSQGRLGDGVTEMLCTISIAFFESEEQFQNEKL